MDKIRIGVSKCLLGEPVRYDGQHKHNHFITDTLGPYLEYVGVCPEVECGMGVPRETLRLVGDPAAPRLMTTRTGIDHTERMQTWASRRIKELDRENLHGYIFKSASPSSGMERVKVYGPKGGIAGRAPGMFGKLFMEHFEAGKPAVAIRTTTHAFWRDKTFSPTYFGLSVRFADALRG